MQRSKNYLESKKILKKEKYPLDKAIELVKETSKTKFDSSIELHINLNLNTKGDQSIRGVVDLPYPTGKEIRIAVLASSAKQKEAKKAGAKVVGGEDLIEKIKKGFLDFDLMIAEPAMMSKIGKLGKILGEKGLMPNPKSGTVTSDIKETVKKFTEGRIEFRMDKTKNIHQVIGKASFEDKKIKENILVLFKAIIATRPDGNKGAYINNFSLVSTMGPGIKVEASSVR